MKGSLSCATRKGNAPCQQLNRLSFSALSSARAGTVDFIVLVALSYRVGRKSSAAGGN
jgi:hypothetical protein